MLSVTAAGQEVGVVCYCCGIGEPGAGLSVTMDTRHSSSPNAPLLKEHATYSESRLNVCWHERFGIGTVRHHRDRRDWFARVVQHPFVAC